MTDKRSNRRDLMFGAAAIFMGIWIAAGVIVGVFVVTVAVLLFIF